MAAGDGPMGACDGLTRAEAELFAWLQEVRTRAGRLPARLHPGLLRAAREKAAELAATLRADHGDPWAPGPRERQAASGVRLRVMGGELLALQPDLARVRLAWWASPAHRTLLLLPEHRWVGVAVAPVRPRGVAACVELGGD